MEDGKFTEDAAINTKKLTRSHSSALRRNCFTFVSSGSESIAVLQAEVIIVHIRVTVIHNVIKRIEYVPAARPSHKVSRYIAISRPVILLV